MLYGAQYKGLNGSGGLATNISLAPAACCYGNHNSISYALSHKNLMINLFTASSNPLSGY